MSGLPLALMEHPECAITRFPIEIRRLSAVTPKTNTKGRQKILQDILNKFLRVFNCFGTLPHHPAGIKNRSFVLSVVKLLAFILGVTLFTVQLIHLHIKAMSETNYNVQAIVQIHFISHVQLGLLTIFGMVTIFMRSKKLTAIISSVVYAVSWNNESDWRVVRIVMRSIWMQLAYLAVSFFTALSMKIHAVRGQQDLFLGLSVPAELVSFFMVTLLTGIIAFRVVHLSFLILISFTLGVQFRRLVKTLKTKVHFVQEDPTIVEEILEQHYYLSHRVRDFDKVFAPSVVLVHYI